MWYINIKIYNLRLLIIAKNLLIFSYILTSDGNKLTPSQLQLAFKSARNACNSCLKPTGNTEEYNVAV